LRKTTLAGLPHGHLLRPGGEGECSDLIRCYRPENRHDREETWSEDNPEDRWRKFTYEEILARDKVSLDIFWLRDDALGDMDNLPEPDEIAEEIVENLEAGLAGFRRVLASLEAPNDVAEPGEADNRGGS
jgi:type I restriction enzyme M protein